MPANGLGREAAGSLRIVARVGPVLIRVSTLQTTPLSLNVQWLYYLDYITLRLDYILLYSLYEHYMILQEARHVI